MALYRCAACGSPNVILDTVNGGIDYNLAKGAIGTVLLGAGGAAAGITSVSTTVFKCPDCGMTLNHAMPDLIKAQIELALVDINGRRCGNQMDWDVLKLQYKNLETRFVDQVYAHTQSEAAFQLKNIPRIAEAEFEAALDTIYRYSEELEANIKAVCNPSMDISEEPPDISSILTNGTLDIGKLAQYTAQRRPDLDVLNGKGGLDLDKITKFLAQEEAEVRKDTSFLEKSPLSLSRYLSWCNAIKIVVENCYHFTPPPVSTGYFYKNYKYYDQKLRASFGFYVFQEFYKTTGKYAANYSKYDWSDFVKSTPFLCSFAQQYFARDAGSFLSYEEALPSEIEKCFNYSPLLTMGLPKFMMSNGLLGYWDGSWDERYSIKFSDIANMKSKYFSKYPEKKTEYNKCYNDLTIRKTDYETSPQEIEILNEQIKQAKALVDKNRKSIIRLENAVLFKTKSSIKAETHQQQNRTLLENIAEMEQTKEALETKRQAFEAEFPVLLDIDDNPECDLWEDELENYLAGKMDNYIIWKWSAI